MVANKELITSNRFVISGLTAGDLLNIRVVAVNAGGRSEPVALAQPVTIQEIVGECLCTVRPACVGDRWKWKDVSSYFTGSDYFKHWLIHSVIHFECILWALAHVAYCQSSDDSMCFPTARRAVEVDGLQPVASLPLLPSMGSTAVGI